MDHKEALAHIDDTVGILERARHLIDLGQGEAGDKAVMTLGHIADFLSGVEEMELGEVIQMRTSKIKPRRQEGD